MVEPRVAGKRPTTAPLLFLVAPGPRPGTEPPLLPLINCTWWAGCVCVRLECIDVQAGKHYSLPGFIGLTLNIFTQSTSPFYKDSLHYLFFSVFLLPETGAAGSMAGGGAGRMTVVASVVCAQNPET